MSRLSVDRGVRQWRIAGAPSREYVYGSSGLLAMISGGATTYYHQDHLGVRLTTDGTTGSATYGQVLTSAACWQRFLKIGV